MGWASVSVWRVNAWSIVCFPWVLFLFLPALFPLSLPSSLSPSLPLPFLIIITVMLIAVFLGCCCCCYILFQLLNSFYITPCALHFSNSPPQEGESERLPGTSRHLGMNHNSGDQNLAGLLFLIGARGTDLEPST